MVHVGLDCAYLQRGNTVHMYQQLVARTYLALLGVQYTSVAPIPTKCTARTCAGRADSESSSIELNIYY